MGNMTIASKSLGCTRQTLTAWIEKEDLKHILQEARDTRLDFAESKLDERINKGDTTALIFFLKTQGRSRGYGQDEQPQQQKILIEVADNTDISKELNRIQQESTSSKRGEQ